MNVLFVTEQFPFPLDTGGNVRTYHLLRALSAEHHVTLLAGRHAELTQAHVAAVREICADVRLVPEAPGTAVRELRAVCRSLVNGAPFVLERHRASAFGQEIAALAHARTQPFDVVHFNHLDAALYLHSVPAGSRYVLDQHNVVSNQVKTTLQSEARVLRKAVLRFDYPRLQRFEAALCNRMDTCLVCSDADAQSLSELGVRSRIAVIPNGVDLDYFRMGREEPASAAQMIFVGTLDYDPCEKGVWYFCREILPLIREQIPEVQFTAIGRNPSKRLKDIAASDAAVVLAGRVEDIRPHVHRAAVFVVPLLSGSGTRLKILEAMAMGAPVVSTSIGAEGIAAKEGEHLCLGDTPADFAAAVLRVLRNRALAARLRVRGRELVEKNYSWQGVCNGLLSEYRQLPQERRGVVLA